MPHPSVSELLAAADAPDARSPELLAHLTACPSCQRVMAHARPASQHAAHADDADDDLVDLPVIDPDVYVRSEQAPVRGGMGRTFVARDRRLGREVAIKQPLGPADVPDPSLRATLRARFAREARLTARLEHPAIVAVHEAGRFAGGDVFYAMRRVHGRSLRDEIAARPSLGERLALLPGLTLVAESLAYAHSKGVVHRDVTTANIMIGEFGETVLIDWGLAAEAGGGSAASASGPYRADELPLTAYGVGTPGFAAPEQARGGSPDPRADVYALGATLYHLVAGEAPEPGTPTPLGARAPEAPPPLVALIQRAMAVELDARFPTAAELAAELRRFTGGQLVASHRYSPRELVHHYARRYRAPLAVGAVALAAVMVLLIAYVRGQTRARAETERARHAAEASELDARRALRRQLGVTASQLADQPLRRLEALAAGIAAVAPARGDGSLATESWQGLVDALAAGPVALPLAGASSAAATMTIAAGSPTLVTAGTDRRLRVWDLTTGAQRRVVDIALDRPVDAVLTPDDAHVMLCGYDPVAEIHPLAGGPPVQLALSAADARCVASPDGTLVLSAGNELVHVETSGRVLARATTPAAVTAIDVSPTPPWAVAVGTVDGRVGIWNGGDAGPVLAPAVHRGPVIGVSFVAGGRQVASGGTDGRAVTQDRADVALGRPRTIYTAPAGMITAVWALAGSERLAVITAATRSDHRDLATALLDGPRVVTVDDFGLAFGLRARPSALLPGKSAKHLRIVEPIGGRDVLLIPSQEAYVNRVLASGDRLVEASSNGATLVWDVRSGVGTGVLLGHSGEIAGLAVRGDALWSASLDGTVRRWSLSPDATGALAPAITSLPAGAIAVATGPRGDHAVALDVDGELWRIEPAAGAPVARRLAGADGPFAFVTLSRDGARLLAGASAGRALLWSMLDVTAPPRVMTVGPAGAGPDLVAGAFSPDGQRVALGAADGSIAITDVATGQTLVTATTPATALGPRPEGVERVTFTPDGATLVVGFSTARTRLLDAATGALRVELEGRAGGAGTAAALGRGHVVTFARDGRVLVHPLAGGAPRALVGHVRPVQAAATTADGARLATSAGDGEVRVWSLERPGAAADEVPLVTFTVGASGAITQLAFLDDGRALAIGTATGGLRVVPIDPALAVERACALITYFGRAEPACP